MQVKTTEGIVEGETVYNEIGGTYHSFKGIPYAAPPIGDLRFKAPKPPIPWEGVRSAKSHGPICHQFNFITGLIELGSEDCLFLNIYTPNVKPSQLLPVMIWIHGGGFVCGRGNDDIYGPEYLIRNGVVLVTLNYRLEVLGFLCLDSEDVPGNAGAKDQVAAMRWVNKNIANFGGDPDNVTIFGQSAGACCVTYHCVSPMTKGLFKRAIVQSGCMINKMGHNYRLRDRAIGLAKRLGCHSEDSKELYEFFKRQPVENIMKIQVPLTFLEKCKDMYEAQATIANEKVFPNVETFFTGNIYDALKNNIHEGLELILGYNEDEGIVNFSIIFDINDTIQQANNFKEYFVPKDLSFHCSVLDQLEIGSQMRNFYLQNNDLCINNLDPLIKFYATDMYKFGMIQFAKYFAVKNKVYFYKFTCKSERNFFSKILIGSKYNSDRQLVGHTDEVAYLFPVKSIKQNVTLGSSTFKLIQNVTKLWTSFAKFGNPTPDTTLGVNWRQYTAAAPSYLDIGNTLVRSSAPDDEEICFWEEIYSKYLPSHMFPKPDTD